MRTPSPRGRRGEAGYNLVMLAVAVTLLNIALAASLPAISAAIQRDKEEELVFRGLQYAEAIRVFQNRFQRPPVRLEELIEVEPRSIRQLWKDPMTEDGKWALIFQGQDQGDPLMPQPAGPDGSDGDGDEEPEESGFGTPKPGETVATGPIIGVRSKSGKASFLLFNGRQRYDEWRFTVDMLGGQRSIQGPEGGFAVPNPAAASAMPINSRWIGRPFDQSIIPPGMQPGNVPQTGLEPTKPRAPQQTSDR